MKDQMRGFAGFPGRQAGDHARPQPVLQRAAAAGGQPGRAEGDPAPLLADRPEDGEAALRPAGRAAGRTGGCWRGWRRPGRDGEAVLRDGLERAVARGALLHVTVQRGDVNRRMVHDQQRQRPRGARKAALPASSICWPTWAKMCSSRSERPPIFVLYEQNIGLLTPMIAEELRDAEQTLSRLSGSPTPSGRRSS